MAGKIGGGQQVPQAKLQSLLAGYGGAPAGGGLQAPPGLLGYNPFTKPSYTPPAPQGFPTGLLRPYFPTGFVNPAQPKPPVVKPPVTGPGGSGGRLSGGNQR